ncbi:MAG: flagellar hook-basal body complex protein FliE [Bryobacteraceae bacterium]|nr:flagellar hook-basal body complex protein FliE [Bryobacteraceae bacterium]
MDAIRPILDRIQLPDTIGAAKPASEAGNEESAFGGILKQAIQQVTGAAQQADESLNSFLRGESEEVHKVALDAQRAEISMEMFLQMRNKVVQAYQEVMRMQL